MQESFFSNTDMIQKAPRPTLPRCGMCRLYKSCKSPKMAMTGKGKKEILVVAASPGKWEDKKGKHHIGQAGQLLRRHFSRLGIDLNRDCWMTNAVICRRKDTGQPTDAEIEACRPNLLNTIKKTNPKIIILLGQAAYKSLLQVLWKEDIGSVTRWGGWSIPSQNPNAWICPTYHPSTF